MNIDTKKVQQLIEILFDPTARVDEKDDAAMDLSEYPYDDAIKALAKIGSYQNEDDIILNSCGESLAQIWVKNNHFQKKFFDQLTPDAKSGVIFVLNNRKPEWTSKYCLDENL